MFTIKRSYKQNVTFVQKRSHHQTLRSQRKKFYQNSWEGNSDKGFHYSRMYFLFCPKGLIHSIFPPLRGKYYKKILSALCVSRERSERAVNIIFRKVPSKKWNLTFGSHMALRDIKHLRLKKNEFMSVSDTNDFKYYIINWYKARLRRNIMGNTKNLTQPMIQ